jgi:outer membrane protein OmpA-like peptidoglycan-associated protein
MRRFLVTLMIGGVLWGCETAPTRYVYPPPADAPLAPPARRAPPPQPVMAAPRPRPVPIGPLTARNEEAYMDGSERELRLALKGAGVGISRPGDELVLYLRDDILFAGASDRLAPRGRDLLAAIANTLERYNGTYISVSGHRDVSDAPAHALQLSQEQADAVARALESDGVESRRIGSRGLGSTRPKIPAKGRAVEHRNDRIEIVISPRSAG